MGYVLRVRMASFFAGAATASFIGLYILHNDYKVAQEAVSRQVVASSLEKTDSMKGLHASLDRRISDLEKLKQPNASDHTEATE